MTTVGCRLTRPVVSRPLLPVSCQLPSVHCQTLLLNRPVLDALFEAQWNRFFLKLLQDRVLPWPQRFMSLSKWPSNSLARWETGLRGGGGGVTEPF